MSASLIVLTDFFQAADRALNYATGLAGPLGARLVLLHVRRDSILDQELFTGRLSNLSQEAIALALSRVSGNLPVPVVAEVGHGRVASAAADAASRHQPALLVLGRPDYSDTPDELVQTTSLDILRLAPYPVLVVPHAWAGSAPPRRVLLAVDGGAFALGPQASAARLLLSALGVEATVLHVTPEEGEREGTDAELTALESVAQSGLMANLPHIHTRTVVHARPSQGILDEAQASNYDLVVLIARSRSFLGELFHRSVTAQVLLHSDLPVLLVPAH